MARVFDLVFDEWNEREYAPHGVHAEEILQTLDNAPVFLPNKRGHGATLVMIGPFVWRAYADRTTRTGRRAQRLVAPGDNVGQRSG